MPSTEPDVGEQTSPGSRHYRAWIGATQTYDIFSHMQFSLLTLLGLRENQTLLDIGCGSLRAGKLFISYLLPERYFGIEPEQWLVQEGLEREIGGELVARKQPRFLYDRDFTCTAFNMRFDYILAQSIFSHASRAQIERCLSQVRECMKPTSMFAASFVEGDTDYEGREWVYPGTIPFRLDTMIELARQAGLVARRLDWFHIGGQTWLLFSLPGLEPEIEQLATLNQMAPLRVEMSHYKMRSDRLERIEKNPLYRLMAKVRRLTRRR